MCGAGPLPKRLLLLMLLGKVAEGMGLISNLLHVGNELESRRVQPARRGIFLR